MASKEFPSNILRICHRCNGLFVLGDGDSIRTLIATFSPCQYKNLYDKTSGNTRLAREEELIKKFT